MRVHKSGRHHPSTELDLFHASALGQRLHFRARSHRRDYPVTYQQSSIANDTEIGKRVAATRDASAQRKQLRCTSDEQARSQVVSIMPNPKLAAQRLPERTSHAGAKNAAANLS